ncbi:proline--tRNA ligase, partial [bacterium]
DKGLGVTPQSEDYSKWYTDVVQKAELADYGPIKGTMVMRPYGYAIWENIQKILDQKFKETGHENAYFPMFIPMSYLQKEAQHVEGFAPELAIVTHAGGKELEEPMVVRPTSETIINSMFSKWVKSHRDLPLLINQWANVVRWEMRPRLFLRTTEFLWQEGHTAHSTEKEAEEEAKRMLDIYLEFANDYAAIAPIAGQKSESEKFAGAVRTYTIEAMMRDKKALQSATSHFLGQNFAKAFDIKFQSSDNKLEYAWQTSWGLSTRMIGAIIMSHGDDKGLILPPNIAPYQIVIIPVMKNPETRATVMEATEAIRKEFAEAGIRVKVDTRENMSPGFKYNEWEMKGVPLRLEVGPRDLENNQVILARRDTFEKNTISRDGLKDHVLNNLKEIQDALYNRAKSFREENTVLINSYDELKDFFSDEKSSGFALIPWAGDGQDEKKLKEELKITSRCIPFDQEGKEEICIITGKPTTSRAIFAKAY